MLHCSIRETAIVHDNFEELRSGKAKRPRGAKPAPVAMPIGADIAAVTLVEQPAIEPVELPIPVQPVQTQEEPIMATTAETVTNAAADTGTKVLHDMNDRAKGAMERGTKLFDEMNELNRGNVEALVESTRIAVKGFEQMAREGAEQARAAMEAAQANMRALASVKSPTEFMKLQADFARAAVDASVARASHGTEAMLKLAGEIAQPVSNRVAVVASRMKMAA